MNILVLRPLISITVLLVVLLLEYIYPKRALKKPRSERWSINLGLALFNFLLLKLTGLDLAISAAEWSRSHQFGLFNQWNFSSGLTLILSIFFLDLIIYFQHRFFHLIPFFWRYHRVHHSDTDFDTTTAVRFHPLEIIFSMIIKVFFILLLGAPVTSVIIFEAILNGCALFNHGNFRISGDSEKFLRLFIVTPDMHRIHHSIDLKESNTNFGFSISLWDFAFKTYTASPHEPHQSMQIGLVSPRDSKELTFLKLLKMPFKN